VDVSAPPVAAKVYLALAVPPPKRATPAPAGLLATLELTAPKSLADWDDPRPPPPKRFCPGTKRLLFYEFCMLVAELLPAAEAKLGLSCGLFA